MERLDACYFCGTAADAPLREVSITHRARADDPDAGVAVTLCPDCEDKLQAVLGRVFEHVESRRVVGVPADDEGAAADDGDEDADEADEPTTRAARRERVDRIDLSTAGGPDGRRRLFDDGPDLREVGDGDVEDAAGETEEPTPRATADAAAPTDDGGARAADDDGEVLGDEPTPVRARATRTDPLDGVSVAEYNRVMRLLQNRDFPMDRAAFVDLATSAYELDDGTVEQVLDAVIDQGALADRDGDLVRPGEGGGTAP